MRVRAFACVCESVRACMERDDNGFSVNINVTMNLEGLLTDLNCSNCPCQFRAEQNACACRASFNKMSSASTNCLGETITRVSCVFVKTLSTPLHKVAQRENVESII